MKTLKLLPLLAGLLIGWVGSVQAQKHYTEIKFPKLNEINVPDVDRVELDNGLTLFLLQDHELPVINISARIGVGSFYEPADKVGLAGITGNAMRTGGSANMSGDEIDLALESIGATVETNIGQNAGFATSFALKEDIDKVLPILADLLMNPAFPEDKIDLAKVQQKSGISRRNDNPQQIAFREFGQLVYGEDSPYARTTEYATINAIARDDVVGFHQAFFHPNNTMIAVWGDFRKEEMVEKVKAAFANWSSKENFQRPELSDVDYTYKNTVNFAQKDDVNQSTVLLGHIGGRYDNPDYFALQVMNNILGGGFSSRLFQNVRDEQGLAYAVFGGYNSNYDYPGQFFAGVMTKSETTVQAAKAVLREVEKMREEEVTDDELSQAKEAFLNSFVFNFDTRAEIINRLMTYDYYDYPEDFLQQTKAGVEQTTKGDVLRVARQYLKPDQVHFMVVGNAKDFDEPLSVLGTVNEVDITIPEPGTPAPEATAESETQGKTVLDEAVEAAGGADIFDGIKSVWQKGAGKVETPQGMMNIEIEMTFALPDQVRMEISLPVGKLTQVLNGENAYMDGFGQKGPAPPQVKDQLEEALWQDLIYLYANRDRVQVQYLGQEEVEGASCDVVLITPPAGKVFKLYVDAGTRLAVQIVAASPAGDIVSMYSDFRDVAGLKVPFKTVSTGAQNAEIILEELNINANVDENVFTIGE